MQRFEMWTGAHTAGVDDENYLLDRSEGDKVFPYLEEALRCVPEQQALQVVFKFEQRANASFMDATIVKLAHQITLGNYGQRGLIVSGLNPGAAFDIEAAVDRRQKKASQNRGDFNAAVLFWESDKPRRWSLLGDIEPTLYQTLEVVGKKGEASAADIAAAQGLEMKAASTRLKRLFERSLLWRQEHKMPTGREFIYRFWA